MSTPPNQPLLARRRFLGAAILLAPVVIWPGLVRAATAPRRLAFYHTHTSETLDIVYSENGAYLPDALAEINYLLRDFRSGDLHRMDPALLDLLHDVQDVTGQSPGHQSPFQKGRFEVISAYRSPATNRMLAETRGGVAGHSMHLVGQAIDVRLPGIRTADLHRVALGLQGGGVGYYPASDFVHIDTGRVRSW